MLIALLMERTGSGGIEGTATRPARLGCLAAAETSLITFDERTTAGPERSRRATFIVTYSPRRESAWWAQNTLLHRRQTCRPH